MPGGTDPSICPQVNRFNQRRDRALLLTDRHLYKLEPGRQYRVMRAVPLDLVSLWGREQRPWAPPLPPAWGAWNVLEQSPLRMPPPPAADSMASCGHSPVPTPLRSPQVGPPPTPVWLGDLPPPTPWGKDWPRRVQVPVPTKGVWLLRRKASPSVPPVPQHSLGSHKEEGDLGTHGGAAGGAPEAGSWGSEGGLAPSGPDPDPDPQVTGLSVTSGRDQLVVLHLKGLDDLVVCLHRSRPPLDNRVGELVGVLAGHCQG